jgi:hypothetical protein
MFVGHVDEAEIPVVPGQSVAWYGRQFCQLVALPEKTFLYAMKSDPEAFWLSEHGWY